LTERQQARREKLIEAGIEVYGTHGFFAVTVKDICNEAKLTERYFYESFKKSDQLFQTIFLKLIDELQQNVMQAIMQASNSHEKMVDAGLTAHAFVMLMMPNIPHSEREISWVSTGLNGYVTQIAIRWVISGFKQSLEDVLASCRVVFLALLESFSEKKN